MLEVKDLTKRFGNHTAVDRLNFTVERGHIYGFLGPNGAGKSTTMKMITGYLAPTEGSVMIDGHDILKEPLEAKKRIGYLPEFPPLYPDMTVREYLGFVAELKRIKKADRSGMVAEVTEKTGLAAVENRLIRNLSKGYRQRVGIAEAMLGFPDLIILDEPTVGLDPAQIIEIRDLIRSLGEKHTVILSSHILQEISAVCDHIMVISHGRLVASDTADHLADSMSDSVTMKLLVRSTEKELKDALEGMKGIREFRVSKGAEQDRVQAEIVSDAQEDIREETFRRLAEKRLPVLDMHSDVLSLEDVYLKLTEDPAVEAPESAESEEAAAETPEKEKAAAESEDPAVEAPESSESEEAAEKTPEKEKAAAESEDPAEEAPESAESEEAQAEAGPETAGGREERGE